MSTSIDQALFTKLTGTTALTAIVGTRITDGWRQNDAGLPSVVINRVSTRPFGTSSGTDKNRTIGFEITIEAQTPAQARVIAEIIASESVLLGWKSTDPVSGPFRWGGDTYTTINPVTGENYGYGRIVQEFTVTLKI